MTKHKTVVLVEPHAAYTHGHYRDKLHLWITGFGELGYAAEVVSADPVEDWQGAKAEFRFMPKFLTKLLRRLPNGLCQYMVMSFCYALAIRRSREISSPMIGLSTRGAIPLRFGVFLAGFRVPEKWATCIMAYQEEKATGGLQRWSFKSASRSGCHFLFNLLQNKKRLEGTVTTGHAHFSPDPMRVSKVDRDREIRPRPLKRIMVSGLDNPRRDAFQLLREIQSEKRVPKLRLQYIRKGRVDAGDFLGFAEEIEHCDRFYFGEEFSDLFRSSDATLISYSPEFSAGSANLVVSIVCGTPVVMSRFPAALSTAEMYGRVGEFFDYGNREGFASALEKLQNWGEAEWREFAEARDRIMREADYKKIAGNTLRMFG